MTDQRMTVDGNKVMLHGKVFAEWPDQIASEAIFGAFTYLGYSGAEYNGDHDKRISVLFF